MYTHGIDKNAKLNHLKDKTNMMIPTYILMLETIYAYVSLVGQYSFDLISIFGKGGSLLKKIAQMCVCQAGIGYLNYHFSAFLNWLEMYTRICPKSVKLIQQLSFYSILICRNTIYYVNLVQVWQIFDKIFDKLDNACTRNRRLLTVYNHLYFLQSFFLNIKIKNSTKKH